MLAAGDPLLLLDVREPFERDHCRIADDDLHIPLGQVMARVEEIRSRADGRTLIVYCHHGVRSRAAADWLLAQGLPAPANLTGGIEAWSRLVDPTVARY